MRNAPSRRNVMATGAALALAAPLSSLTAASASDAEDWPEFAEWLAVLNNLEAREAAYRAATANMDRAEIEAYLKRPEVMADDVEIDGLYERYFPLVTAMLGRPIETERQFAMATAVWIYDHERRLGSSLGFDLTNYDDVSACSHAKQFVLTASRRIVDLLPEVPIVLPVEG